MNVSFKILTLLFCGALLLTTVSCTTMGTAFDGTFTETHTEISETSLVDEAAELPERGFYMGFLPMPAEDQSFEEAYKIAGECADFVPVWGRPTPFYDLPEDLEGEWGGIFVEEYTRGNGLFPLVQMSFIGENMGLVSPIGIIEPGLSHPVWREAYKKAAVDVVHAVKPRYLSLGNEVNRWYETYGDEEDDPNAFRHFVSLYEETYDAVKEISPETVIFCTFAREIVAQNRSADMNVIRMFDPAKLDILVLTSYPHSNKNINLPSDIPEDYYTQAARLLPEKPFGFSEVAWPSLDAFGGEEAQADFLELVTGKLTAGQGIDLVLLGWSWLTDLSDGDSVGLVQRDGARKQAFSVWRAIYILGKYRDRESTVPTDAVKMGPDNDVTPPVLHSDDFFQPVPLPSPVNTAGAEDSPFITPDGKTLYIWFTPDVSVSVQGQLQDVVTGIYMARLDDNGTWSRPERVALSRGHSLDGCVFVRGGTMWFASAREGYTGLNWFTARMVDGVWQDWQYAGDEFPARFEVGELHFTLDGNTLYFHSSRDGGNGGYDIWVSQKENGQWQTPENIRAVNTRENDGWPYVNDIGTELWFTRSYEGSPAIFVSRLVDGIWGKPEMVISRFAGEPTLDAAGNIYFVHHYYRDGVMLESDIYIAKRK